MSFRRNIAEQVLRVLAPKAQPPPKVVRSIFVLRNNDLGDLLVVTPLFAALRDAFPSARIVLGCGDWARPVVENNPHVDAILPVNAPWHNHPIQDQSPRARLKYLLTSPEIEAIRREAPDVGIDVLGSIWGTALLARAGIRCRLGVRGYAGGHQSCWRSVDFAPDLHVGAASLRFAAELGAQSAAYTKPILALTPAELAAGEALWAGAPRPRVLLAPGAGFPEKAWPPAYFAQTANVLMQTAAVAVTGGPKDGPLGAQIAAAAPGVKDFCGKLSLRETFALAAVSDAVLCNSSLMMHAAAALDVPAVVVLGRWFASASAHARQWGHRGQAILGPEPEAPAPVSPVVVIETLRNQLCARKR